MKRSYSLVAVAHAMLAFTMPAYSQDFGSTVSAAMDAFREVREQNAAPTEIKAIFAKAKIAEGDGCICFCGFYLGMTADDVRSLVAHHGLKSEEWDTWVVPSNKSVYKFRFSLKGVRRLTKGGNSFDELAQAVANRIGDMKAKHNDDYDLIGFEYKNIDGQTAVISEKDGLVYEDVNLSRKANEEQVEIRHKVAAELDEMAGIAISEKAKSAVAKLADNLAPIPDKGYLVSKYEVTQSLWFAVMGENPSKFKGEDLPVESISYDDCLIFVKKLNALPEVRASGYRFRLLTKEEWDFAARTGLDYSAFDGAVNYACIMPDGRKLSTYSTDEIAWFSGNRTHPVGQKKPNAFGLYDMFGNVEEWVVRGEYLNSAGGSWKGKGGGADSNWLCAGMRFLRESKDDRTGLRLAAEKVSQ